MFSFRKKLEAKDFYHDELIKKKKRVLFFKTLKEPFVHEKFACFGSWKFCWGPYSYYKGMEGYRVKNVESSGLKQFVNKDEASKISNLKNKEICFKGFSLFLFKMEVFYESSNCIR